MTLCRSFEIRKLYILQLSKTRIPSQHKRSWEIAISKPGPPEQGGARGVVSSPRVFCQCALFFWRVLEVTPLWHSDTIKATKIIRGSFDTAFELTKVIKCSLFLKTCHIIKLSKLRKYVFHHYKAWERKPISVCFLKNVERQSKN